MRALLLPPRHPPPRFRASGRDEEGARAPAPPERAPDTTAPRGAAPIELGRAPVVLIVDDDPLMTQMLPRRLARLLSSAPRVLTASTPEEGIRLMSELQPDVILCDYNLRAVMTGLDVLAAAQVRAPHATRILFSGHTRREIGVRLDDAPIHGYVEKPMRLDDLVGPIVDLVREASGLDLGLRGHG